MKKIFESIGLFSLLCFSFYYTSQIDMVIKQNDDILIEINEIKDQYNIEPINAIINNNTIIPGVSGSKINVEKSYNKMKKINSFNENLLVYETVKPNISVKDMYDKYIISGNKMKKQISLIFIVKPDDNINSLINILDEYEIEASFFVDGVWFENNNDLILSLIEKNHTLGTTGYSGRFDNNVTWINSIIKKIANQKDTYCYNEGDNNNLNICSKYTSYSIKPTLIIKNKPYITIKKEIENGSIIALEINENLLKELPLIINYIDSKGYELVNIENLLDE